MSHLTELYRLVAMTRMTQRIALIVLAATAVAVGGWAAIGPRSFYDSFPGLGRAWVGVDGPYNEHLVRDVGAFYLAMLVLTVAALWRLEPVMVRVAGASWLVFGALHLGYHAINRQVLGSTDQVLNLGGLALSVALAAALLLPVREGIEH